MVDEEYSKNRLLPLVKRNTNAATLSVNSEDLLELVSTSTDEEEDDRPRALPSIVFTGGKLPTAPGHNGRTRHVIMVDSVHCPDALMSSGMVADGSVAYAKTTTTLYEQAAGPARGRSQLLRLHLGLPAWPMTIVVRRTARRLQSRSLRSDPESSSRDESPSRRRRPSFDTTPSARRSPNGIDDQRSV